MRTPNIGTVFYTPSILPDDPKDAKRFLQDELQKISYAIQLLALGHLDKTIVAPAKPRDGDIRYADGTSWNPGGTGAGIYWYNGTAWAKL